MSFCAAPGCCLDLFVQDSHKTLLAGCRYALAAILRVLSAELVAVLPDRFSTRTRKRLFDLLGSWTDDGSGVYQSADLSGGGDYRREVERFKQAQTLKMRESQDRMALDRDLADQVGALRRPGAAAERASAERSFGVG